MNYYIQCYCRRHPLFDLYSSQARNLTIGVVARQGPACYISYTEPNNCSIFPCGTTFSKAGKLVRNIRIRNTLRWWNGEHERIQRLVSAIWYGSTKQSTIQGLGLVEYQQYRLACTALLVNLRTLGLLSTWRNLTLVKVQILMSSKKFYCTLSTQNITIYMNKYSSKPAGDFAKGDSEKAKRKPAHNR